MIEKSRTVSSKFLSLILRHKPQLINLRLDRKGWANVQELIRKVREHGRQLDREMLENIVEADKKRRFSFSEDRNLIRANQGHSVVVDLCFEPQVPPSILYHGTSGRSVEAIMENGIHKQGRHHVHLSSDKTTAIEVGRRHGKPVVFEIQAEQMHCDGFEFFISENEVWLTEVVPTNYFRVL